MEINFTPTHLAKMKELLMEKLLANATILNTFGQPLTVVELLHTTSINSLNKIRIALSKKIEELEDQDEWVAKSVTQKSLEKYRSDKELVNLIIGYKRWQLELSEVAKKKSQLEAQIHKMREEAKTPQQRLVEAENELAHLDNILRENKDESRIE